MADIFEEVEEGLRRDRYVTLFRKYGPVGAAVVAAVILGVAGREVWTAMQERASTRSSDAFAAAEAAFEAGDLDAAMTQFAALAEQGSGAYPVLAKMQEAASAVAAGSDEEAAQLYEDAAARTRDPLLGHLASLKAAYLVADRLDIATLEARLAPLMEPNAPYEVMARELLGSAALAAGDYAKAREAYTYLTVSLAAPGGVQRRAAEALAVIDAAQAVAATDEEG
jgi:hypothetical protein